MAKSKIWSVARIKCMPKQPLPQACKKELATSPGTKYIIKYGINKGIKIICTTHCSKKKKGNERPVRFYHVHLALLLAGKQG